MKSFNRVMLIVGVMLLNGLNPLLASQATITTVVGNHAIGGTFSGDGGPATSAGLSGPLGLTFYGGNLYFADAANAAVRVAYGGGGPGNNVASTYPSTLRWFITPLSIQIDGNGYLYVGDGDWGSILKFQNFDEPPLYLGNHGPAQSIALDAPGQTFASVVYSVDLYDDQASWTSVTPNSPTVPIFNQPGLSTSFPANHGIVTSGVTYDSTWGLFVADIANNVIRDGGGNRIMGTGTAGFSGDGGNPLFAKLNHPAAVAVRGNFLYIADSGNNRIRQVDLVNHVITTIAGNGQSGYSGDNDDALNAKLNSPGGLAIDPAGNIYVSDTGNDVIRKLTFYTKVTTVVGDHSIGGSFSGDGGPATSAGLSGPLGLTFYGGNLYFADAANAAVRVAYGGGGPGNSVASTYPSILRWFITPLSIQIDGNGYLYVGDGDWGSILKFQNFDEPPLYLGDHGPAVSIALDWPGQTFASTVYSVDLYDDQASWTSVTPNGTTTPIFNQPGLSTSFPANHGIVTSGVTFDGTWGLFVADIANNVIRDSGGNRIMGTGTAGFSGDGGQAINAKLNHPSAVVVRGNFLYIADSGNNRIRRVDLNSHIITTIAGNGQSGYSGDNGNALGAKFNAPGGLTFDPAGNLYISDTGNDVIRRLDF